jgi:hypothetical protein
MSDVMLCAAIAGLILLDGGFAGYRARAGRYARIRRLPHDLRAVARGCAVAGAVALLAAGAAFAFSALQAGGLHPHAREAAQRILAVAGLYATLVIVAFVPFLTGSPDLRSLTTVVLFGPFTVLRPVVVIAATVAAAWGHATPVMLSAAVGGTLVFLQDPLLERLGRRDPRL